MTPEELSVIWNRVIAWQRGNASYPDAAVDLGIVLEEVVKLKEIVRTMCVLINPDLLETKANEALVADLLAMELIE